MLGQPNPRTISATKPSSSGLAAALPVDRYLQKLQEYPLESDRLAVRIENPLRLSEAERAEIMHGIRRRNFVVYEYDETNPAYQSGYRHICRQLELEATVSNPAADEHGVTSIEVVNHPNKAATRYIPFTNQTLNWHTDGYYNNDKHAIRSFVLHCRRPAVSGGATSLIDHELMFALLYQQNPDWVEALAQSDVLTIPANIENGKTLREEFTGSVFEKDPITGQLIMRYTERKRHIFWKQDSVVLTALDAIKALLYDQSPWVSQLVLQPGQGVIANNVLHHRTAFSDAGSPATSSRKLERIRFSNRVNTAENEETLPL